MLASFHSSTQLAWEGIVNTLLGSAGAKVVDSAFASCMRAARIAMWEKEGAATRSARITGMTSVISKTAWRCGILQHKRTHKLPQNAAAAKGGAVAAMRRVYQHVRDGGNVYVADVSNAFWNVSRQRVSQFLHDTNSPIAFLFNLMYGQRNALIHNRKVYLQEEGVLPGDGGAAIAFMIDLQIQLSEVPRNLRANVIPYMDDLIALDESAMAAAIKAIGANRLAKAKVIGKSKKKSITIEGLEMQIVPAAKHLGVIVGDAEKSEDIQHEMVKRIQDKITTVINAKVSCQAKWKMIQSVVYSAQWKATAIHPTIFAGMAPRIDAIFTETLQHFIAPGAQLTNQSCMLQQLPKSAGGLGLMSLTLDSAALYDLTTAAISATGEVEEDEDGRLFMTTNVGRLRRALHETRTTRALSTFKQFQLDARKDASIPWFDVSNICKRTRIDDTAWRHAMTIFLMAECGYPTCQRREANETEWDHSNTCIACAAPFRYQRHQRVLHEILQSAFRYGVLATTNITGLFGNVRKMPDAVVHRPNHDTKLLLLDVTVPHQGRSHIVNRMNLAVQTKAKKYEKFDKNSEIRAFVLSTTFTLEPRTFETIEEMAKLAVRPGFTNEVVARVKQAAVVFEAYRFKALLTKKENGTFSDPLEPESE